MNHLNYFNCGLNHDTAICEFPWMIHRCPRCLVLSLDGSGHTNPCLPLNTIGSFRTDISSWVPMSVFGIRVRDAAQVLYLDSVDERFVPNVDGPKTLLSPSIEGIFQFNVNDSNYKQIDFNAVSIKRFSVIFAILVKGT